MASSAPSCQGRGWGYAGRSRSRALLMGIRHSCVGRARQGLSPAWRHHVPEAELFQPWRSFDVGLFTKGCPQDAASPPVPRCGAAVPQHCALLAPGWQSAPGCQLPTYPADQLPRNCSQLHEPTGAVGGEHWTHSASACSWLSPVFANQGQEMRELQLGRLSRHKKQPQTTGSLLLEIGHIKKAKKEMLRLGSLPPAPAPRALLHASLQHHHTHFLLTASPSLRLLADHTHNTVAPEIPRNRF